MFLHFTDYFFAVIHNVGGNNVNKPDSTAQPKLNGKKSTFDCYIWSVEIPRLIESIPDRHENICRLPVSLQPDLF